MTDRVKLKKFVEIFGDLLKIEGNEWLVDEILKTIENTSPIEEIAKHSVIQNIHEYCVEQKIDKQAAEFYSNFPIEDIRPKLIQDYKKMEHERRRDDFENFCLCMYQQIENITNFLYENNVREIWNTERNNIAIKSKYDREQENYVFPEEGGVILEKLIFGETNPNCWYANRKFRAVLFFYYFNKEIIKDDYFFNSIYYTHEEIYQMRNQNHRGGNVRPYSQNIINRISGNESKYYFKFYGFLQDFVLKIESAMGNA